MVFSHNRTVTVAGLQINNIAQGMYYFLIMVGNSYHIYVVVAIYFQLVTDGGYLFVCVGDSCFFGGG